MNRRDKSKGIKEQLEAATSADEAWEIFNTATELPGVPDKTLRRWARIARRKEEVA